MRDGILDILLKPCGVVGGVAPASGRTGGTPTRPIDRPINSFQNEFVSSTPGPPEQRRRRKTTALHRRCERDSATRDYRRSPALQRHTASHGGTRGRPSLRIVPWRPRRRTGLHPVARQLAAPQPGYGATALCSGRTRADSWLRRSVRVRVSRSGESGRDRRSRRRRQRESRDAATPGHTGTCHASHATR